MFNNKLKKAVMNLLRLITSSIEKLKVFAQKRHVKYLSQVMEPSNRFHTLVEFVEAEDLKEMRKNRTLDLPLEINNVNSKQESQSLFTEPYKPYPEIKFAQTLDLIY